MSKHVSRKRQRSARSSGMAEIIEFSKFESERVLPPIRALNPTQADYLDALRSSPQVVVLGPAGTGKTWIAATYAADLYRTRQISKIILSRPNVPCGRSLGFFPGSLEDKFAPWAVPVVDAIKDRIGTAAYQIALKRGDIEMVPFEVMRGRSWQRGLRAARRGPEHDAGGDQDLPHPRRRGLLGGDQRRREPMRSRRSLRSQHRPATDQVVCAAGPGDRVRPWPISSAPASAPCGCARSRRRSFVRSFAPTVSCR